MAKLELMRADRRKRQDNITNINVRILEEKTTMKSDKAENERMREKSNRAREKINNVRPPFLLNYV